MFLQRNWMFPVLLAVATLAATGTSSYAQFANKPFQFKNSSGGGIGMSIGGQQAILNQELFGATPRNLLRDRNGELLGIQSGPNRIPIVTAPGGQLIPGFRPSFRDDSPALSAGVFNAYFASGTNSSTAGLIFSDSASGVTVETWTAGVVSDGLAVPLGSLNPVTSWTSSIGTQP